jgi:hypothetical protein
MKNEHYHNDVIHISCELKKRQRNQNRFKKTINSKLKNGNCQNKIDTFFQFFHGVKPSFLTRDRLELASKFNDIFRNYLIGILK